MPAWLMIALGLPTFGLAFAVAFVVLTYLGALRLTGGKFGWPGFRYSIFQSAPWLRNPPIGGTHPR